MTEIFETSETFRTFQDNSAHYRTHLSIRNTPYILRIYKENELTKRYGTMRHKKKKIVSFDMYMIFASG
jgi:hypothetical protein